MRILVTGGAGFIGSHLAEAYAERGHQVLVVDNLSTGKRENVPARTQFVEADLLDRERLAEIFTDFAPEVVNHHAAQTNLRLSWNEPVRDARNNILASLYLLECCVCHRTGKIIYASSGGAIYGEPDSLPVTEDHPIRPISNYGVSKYAGELYLRTFSEGAQLPYVVLRYPNVYGPRQDPQGEAGVVAIFTYQMLMGIQPRIYGDGSKTRDYVHIEDIVDANVRALDVDNNAVVNLGCGREISDAEVFQAVQKAVGSNLSPVFEQKRLGEINHICLDSSRAQKLFGWQPRIGFEDGVRRVVAYWKGHLAKQRGG